MGPFDPNLVKRIVSEAAGIPREKRGPFLDESCGRDAGLRTEVESLLASLDRERALLSSPLVASEDLETLDPSAQPVAGTVETPATRIGPYKLIKQVGEGGFGSVFLAEQEKPVRRQVALKIIKLGMDTGEVIARFEQERQALAIMDHPNIAKVFDAGATGTGRPYFVMEFVRGLPITEFCDGNNLPLRERLSLFVTVCGAVQHAHQKGLIHRDIKPSNILVAMEDGKPSPKIIDFGIAKATEQKLTERTMFTELGQFIGTPAYMSPEQAEGSLDIDTRSDIYSLGIVLYELLTGVTPFDTRTLRRAGFDEIRRFIREEEPSKPSTRLSTVGEELASVAKRRSVEPKKLGALLRGDLDWIVMKALEKDRRRRYETSNGLGMDIQRYLGGEAVVAAPPSASYRFGKFVSRHRGRVIAATASLVVLIGFAATMAVQARRIAAERERASQQARTAEEVAEFMTGLFKSPDPDQARGKQLTAREVLDHGREQIARLQGEPMVQADLLHAMAASYRGLGFFKTSLELDEKALDLRLRLLGPDHFKTLTSLQNLALDSQGLGQFKQAEELARRVLEQKRRILGPDDERTLRSFSALGGVLFDMGRVGEAISLYREALAGYRRTKKDTRDLWVVQSNLANVLAETGALEEASQLAEEALRAKRQSLGPDHPDIVYNLQSLASIRSKQGRVREAIALETEALETAKRVLGEDHPETLQVLNGLAVDEATLGERQKAEALYREVLASKQKRLGPNHPSTLDTANNLAVVLSDSGRFPEAETLLESVERGYRASFGDKDPRTLIAVYNRAALAAEEGKADETFRLLDAVIRQGFSMADEMEKDTAWGRLRSDPRFARALARVRENQSAGRKPVNSVQGK